MKTWLFMLLVVTGTLVWFRSGMRWGQSGRGNLVALLVFAVLLLGLTGLVLLAVKLF